MVIIVTKRLHSQTTNGRDRNSNCKLFILGLNHGRATQFMHIRLGNSSCSNTNKTALLNSPPFLSEIHNVLFQTTLPMKKAASCTR